MTVGAMRCRPCCCPTTLLKCYWLHARFPTWKTGIVSRQQHRGGGQAVLGWVHLSRLLESYRSLDRAPLGVWVSYLSRAR